MVYCVRRSLSFEHCLRAATNSIPTCTRLLPYRENPAAAVKIARIVASRYVMGQLITPALRPRRVLTSSSAMKYGRLARNAANRIESAPAIQTSSI